MYFAREKKEKKKKKNQEETEERSMKDREEARIQIRDALSFFLAFPTSSVQTIRTRNATNNFCLFYEFSQDCFVSPRNLFTSKSRKGRKTLFQTVIALLMHFLHSEGNRLNCTALHLQVPRNFFN